MSDLHKKEVKNDLNDIKKPLLDDLNSPKGSDAGSDVINIPDSKVRPRNEDSGSGVTGNF